jgi:O-antigen/teichoic acid export membrane protein
MGIALVVGLLRNIVFGKLMTPEEMGYYSIALTIASYGMLFQLGVINGLGRELPFALGQKKHARAITIVGESTIVLCLLQGLSVILYSIIILNIPFTDDKMRSVFLWGGILALSTPFIQLIMLRLRSEQRVIAFSVTQVISSISILLIGAAAIKYMSYLGAIISIIIINFSIYIIISKKYLEPVRYTISNIKNIKYLIKIGLPLMLGSILLNLQMGMDRIFLIKYFSVKEIGIYQVGIIPLILGTAASGIVSQYVSPKLLYRFGEGKPLSYVFSRARLVSFITIAIMGLFIPFVFFGSKFIIQGWLPKYIGSIELITVFYIGAIFISANIIGIVYNAANKQIIQLYMGILLVLLSFVSYTVISFYSMPIVWYAYINTTFQIIYYLLTFSLCFYIAKNKTITAIY